jgi:glycosyltransferase involved in cell wall biosynthesis
MAIEPGTVGFLVKTWPKLSETFILEEVLGLERLGRRLHLFALAAPADGVAHAAVRDVRAPVSYVGAPPASCAEAQRAVAAHVRLFAASPGRYLAAALHALRRPEPGRWRDFAAAARLAALMRAHGIGHLHAHFVSEPAAVAELAARLAGTSYSLSAHAKDIYLSQPQVVRRKLAGARFSVTCTEYNRRYLADLAPGARVHRMYHGIDRAQFHPGLRAPAQAVPLILAVGRLREKKGFATLIEACRVMREAGQVFRCEIVGYGEEQPRLEARIRAAGLDGQVLLSGKLAREQVIERYARAAMLVVPSQLAADGDRDGIPNVLLEAMAMQVPVIATAVSGIPELVEDGRNGLLVPPDDAHALADAAVVLLSDRGLRERLGRAGRRAVADAFDNGRNLRLLDQLLEATLPPAGSQSTEIAYILNGFPRLSETFIANEIYLLEKMGLKLRLYSVKREGEPQSHAVIGRIGSPLHYLPAATSLSGTTLGAWLARNLPAFWGAQVAVARRAPLRYAATLCAAAAMCWRYRSGPFKPRKVYIKEFLQAGHIAADLQARGATAHVHGHFCHGVANIAWFVSRLTGITFSFTAHAKDIYQAELNPGDLLERKLRAARFVATCTEANAGVLKSRCADANVVHTIYHGLDTDYFAPAASPPEPLPLILSVGRFVEKKGFAYLIEACERLRARGLAFGCVIVGEKGSAYEPLRRQLAERALEGTVRLHSAVTQERLREIYRSARVFALPCQVMDDGDRDGIPNVLAEAMAMGVPVISTRISGIPELIDDGVHGLLVESRDADALADALARLLTDPALHARLSEAGRRRICERFDSRRTTEALRDLFVAAVSGAAA